MAIIKIIYLIININLKQQQQQNQRENSHSPQFFLQQNKIPISITKSYKKQRNTTKMGQMCKKQQQEQSLSSTIQITNLQGYDHINFLFTTDKLSRIDTQCLVLFTDKKIKVQRNQFLKKCGQSVANKVQSFLDAYLVDNPTKKLLPGQCVILDTQIPQFSFQKICIICLQVWIGKQKSKITTPLQNCLKSSINKIKQQKINKITIVQFNSQFGIPNNVVNKVLASSIFQQKIGLKNITFVGLTMETVLQIKKSICNFSHNSCRKSSVSKDQSNYY